jgi:predicted RNase H-like HicB family nuclease
VKNKKVRDNIVAFQFPVKSLTADLTVLFFEEDNIHFAFVPSLYLTGYGKTTKEASESLKIVLDEFLRYTLEKNTFFVELQRLGWAA